MELVAPTSCGRSSVSQHIYSLVVISHHHYSLWLLTTALKKTAREQGLVVAAAGRAVPREVSLASSHYDDLVCWVLIEDPCDLLTTLMIIIRGNKPIIRLHRHVFVILFLLFSFIRNYVYCGCTILHYEANGAARSALVRNKRVVAEVLTGVFLRQLTVFRCEVFPQGARGSVWSAVVVSAVFIWWLKAR